MRSKLNNAVDRLVDLSAVLGGLGLVLVTLIILVDVIGRAFGAPLTGAQDLSQMLMVVVVFGGMALCGRLGGHVAVDVFAGSYPAWMNRWLDIFALLLGAAIFAGIAWTVWESSKLSQMLHLATNIIGLPKAWFQWVMVGLAVITSLSMILQALQRILSPNAGADEHLEEVL